MRFFGGALFICVAAVIAFTTLCPIELRPQTGHVLLERAGAFFLLGASAALAFGRRPALEICTVAVLAVGLEAAQRLVSTRHGQPVDALEKIAGGTAGVAVVLIVAALVRLLRRPGPGAPATARQKELGSGGIAT